MIDELRSFVAVVEAESLTGAARKLCVTQSAVSKRIQRLEQVLEARLLDRNSKPPRITALAHRIHERAVPLLASFDRLMHIAREEGDPSGALRFGLPHGIADIILFDALTAMKDTFPALDVTLRTDWTPGLLQLLNGGNLDAAALMTPKGRPPEGYLHRFLTAVEVVVVQSSERPLVSRHAPLSAIAGSEWILNPEGCGYRAALKAAIEAEGGSLLVKADTYGSEIQLQLIASGMGLGLVPKSALQYNAWNRRLEVVDVPRFSPKLDVWLVFPNQMGNLKRAVELLGDTMENSFRPRLP
ncbi:DNA-binding transcriptional regulator, LysR family [Burkholderia sp. YR290]|nr:DNA-binding transcriptional regulator, LysR family [Burkholderia sp. YR290]